MDVVGGSGTGSNVRCQGRRGNARIRGCRSGVGMTGSNTGGTGDIKLRMLSRGVSRGRRMQRGPGLAGAEMAGRTVTAAGDSYRTAVNGQGGASRCIMTGRTTIGAVDLAGPDIR